ncbi:MAG: hypothetical protein BIFFINMI_01480 [Phycisphaerae bacterium]|nr:hypothetical protein [Phycisphaerae bacterium]
MLILPLLAAAEPPAAKPDLKLEFTRPPTLTAVTDGKATVGFALNAAADVEVAILDAAGKVVRHLAAGVLGGQNPPPPPLAGGLEQSIAWDGLDDYGQRPAAAGPFSVRVRAGMSVKLERIAGGNPHMFFLGSHGDHGRWGITGLEVKSDGKVYVSGHSSTLGPVAIRQYDADGKYERTVFPPPAGKDPEAMKGWGIHINDDGTYMLRFNRLTDPSVSTTLIDPELGMARLMPTPDVHRLSLWGGGLDLLTINTDGTIPPAAEQMRGLLAADPPIRGGGDSAAGPVFTCLAPDGKSFYLSGVYGLTRNGRNWEPAKEGFWLDGQVWKVDLATRKATPFFALDAKAVADSFATRGGKWDKSSLGGVKSYSALHGVAVDKEGRLFVADRLDKCVLVLDKDAKEIRRLPVEYPDAVAVSARTGALYVTTRCGCEGSGAGSVGLVKFDNWQKDDKPSAALPNLAHTWYTDGFKHSYVALCEKGDATNVWVAWTELPVQVYRDDGKEMKLVSDFRALAAEQGCWGFDRLEVDRATEAAYVGDDHSTYWKIADWNARQPAFVKVPVAATSIDIDPRNRYLFSNIGGSVWAKRGIARFFLDKEGNPPANFGDTGSNVFTGKLWTEWCFTGNGDMGWAVAANGNLAGMDQRGHLFFFQGTDAKVPWDETELANFGGRGIYGGVRFDLAGNLYVGHRDGTPNKTPPAFKDDPFANQTGGGQGCVKIVKYAPTGTMASGNLFPAKPTGPAKAYDVNLGAFDVSCIVRTPQFNVDAFGRICFPTNIQPRVTLLDNAGNEILHFGTWGNRDSTGGLPDDLVPTKDIPMGLPNSVAATDDYIYVADMVNLRVLRIRKEFALTAGAKGQ